MPADDKESVIIGGWVDGVATAGDDIIVLMSLRRKSRFEGVLGGDGRSDACMMWVVVGYKESASIVEVGSASKAFWMSCAGGPGIRSIV